MYVLMISQNKFPEGDAGAVRDGYFAKIYQELGYAVVHIGMNREIEQGAWGKIKYFSLYKQNSGLADKLKNYCTYGIRLDKVFNEIKKTYGMPNLIHIYDIPEKGVLWAIDKAKKLNIPIIHDSVEWYSAVQFSRGRLSYQFILKERLNKKLIRKPISVIAISTYLEKHFRNKGLSTIRIPVIMDSKDYKPKTRINDGKIHLVYAGSPYGKDYLIECVKAFNALANEIQQKFDFNILGVNRDFVEQQCNGKVSESITVHGRVPREEVIQYLEKSDFSILLRPENERYTKAGFPTKVVESMMNGCAMICNITSDLGMYLHDGVNAVIVEECSVESMTRAFLRVAKMNNDQLIQIRNNARHTAEMSFDYKKYKKDIKQLIENISGRKD